jgi:hypothetical protein
MTGSSQLLCQWAAADVSGVGGPVADGSTLPDDGDADVNAEHAGEDSGGQFGGEAEEGGERSPLIAAGADGRAKKLYSAASVSLALSRFETALLS